MTHETRHVMIDIETLGTQPGSVIIQIGAKRFDPRTGYVFVRDFEMGIDPNYPPSLNAIIDAETLKWWLQQDPKVLAKVMSGTHNIVNGMRGLSEYCSGCTHFWAKSPDFDMGLLGYFYGKYYTSTPWTYKNRMDVRTVLEMADVTQPPAVTPHDAVSDCEAQIIGVLTAYEKCGKTVVLA